RRVRVQIVDLGRRGLADDDVRVVLAIDLRVAAARGDGAVRPAREGEAVDRVGDLREVDLALVHRARDARADHRVRVAPGDALGRLGAEARGDVVLRLVVVVAGGRDLHAERVDLLPVRFGREVLAAARRLERRLLLGVRLVDPRVVARGLAGLV